MQPDPVGITQQEFLAFYDAAVTPLFGYLFRASGGDRSLSEDVSQEVFAIALRHAHQGDRDALTVPWAITVGRNRMIDHWRRAEREDRRLSSLHAAASTPTTIIEPEESLLLEQVRALPPMQRAAVALHYLDGWSVEEVAHRLGKSTKATESLLSRARAALRTPRGVHDD
jgi:RNA polymerase sigma-70 factor (ECF subfamily)